jgi:rRNA-processing protein FCF1
LKKISILGESVDDALVSYVKEHGGIVATIDIKLKMRIKRNGGSILSISNDKIVLEPRKL